MHRTPVYVRSGIPVPLAGSGPAGVSGSGTSVRALLFDMDNTLFDFVEAQMTACNAVTHALGIMEEDQLYPYFLRPLHGFESHENIRDFLRDRGIGGDGMYERARQIYEQEKIRAITPYPGVTATLGRIRERGLPMGIITDAHSRDAVRRLEKAGLLGFFSCMVTWDMVRVKKPAHEPFIAALGMLRSQPDEVILVGDSPRRDIEPARALGFRTVYARYGDRFADDRSDVRADYVIDDLLQLQEILAATSCI